MLYLSNKESLFGIQCTFALSAVNDAKNKKRMCWIYNMNEFKWTSIEPFEYKDYNLSFDCLLCCNEFKQDQIYISAKNKTSMFDLDKNKWISLCDWSISDRDLNRATMWCEYDTLCALEEFKDRDMNVEGFRLHKLDTRSWRPNWSSESIVIDGLPTAYFRWPRSDSTFFY